MAKKPDYTDIIGTSLGADYKRAMRTIKLRATLAAKKAKEEAERVRPKHGGGRPFKYGQKVKLVLFSLSPRAYFKLQSIERRRRSEIISRYLESYAADHTPDT